MKEINLEDVLEFIRNYGWKYGIEIREELDKLRTLTDEDIEKEIKKNYDIYKRLSDK